MKRRDFLKLSIGAGAVVAVPALANQNNPVVFDGVNDYLKTENNPAMGGFTLGSESSLTMHCNSEIVTTNEYGVTIWHDLTGNGNDLIQTGQPSIPIKEIRHYNVAHSKTEREEIIKQMLKK